jgi:hypothetical protein
MNVKILAFCAAFGLLAVANPAFGSETKAKTMPKPAEVTGLIEVVKADPAKNEKYDTVLLKVEKVTYKLLPAKDKKLFKGLESLGGKRVKVSGAVVQPKLPKYPLPALKVESFSVVEAPAPAKK